MKTHVGILSVLMMCVSCAKESVEPAPPVVNATKGNVKVLIDYGFTSGNIKGPIYLNFYNKFILSKVLTPRTYQLIFEGKDSTTFMTTAIGHWGTSNFINLPRGTYAVRGESNPTLNNIAGDTCYLKFDEVITIDPATTSVTLKAIYTCSLILIDTLNVKKAELFSGGNNGNTFKKDLLKTEEYYHTFARDSYLMDRSKYAVNFTLMVTKRNSNVVNLLLWNYFWEAGKYYYFANTESGYSLPAMGN